MALFLREGNHKNQDKAAVSRKDLLWCANRVMNVITLDELQPIQKHSVRTTMHRYVIDLENNITIYETGCDVPLAEGAEEFKSREELGTWRTAGQPHASLRSGTACPG